VGARNAMVASVVKIIEERMGDRDVSMEGPESNALVHGTAKVVGVAPTIPSSASTAHSPLSAPLASMSSFSSSTSRTPAVGLRAQLSSARASTSDIVPGRRNESQC
jgi:hypothetical protein